MQTFPPFCYLAPMALFFGIGPAGAVVLTLIYALPPLVRITEHGIRSVSPTTVEAARSMGLTRGQMLRQVQLPMARRTIVVGINQCMMAALSMATIAALVNGPGLGKPVVVGPADPNVGAASVAGLAIVADGDHARPHHDGGQRARVGGRTRRRVGERHGRDADGRHARAAAAWATEDAGKGQRLPRLTAAGRWLLLGAAARPRGRLRLAVPSAARTTRSSPTSARRRC